MSRWRLPSNPPRTTGTYDQYFENVDRARAEADRLLFEWQQRCLLALLSHARSANRCNAWEAWLGGAGAALTAAVGTGIFASLESDVSLALRIVAGAVAFAAAAAVAVHTFADLPGRARSYERAARPHAANRRRIEVLRARLAAGDEFDVWNQIDEIRVEMDRAAAESPNASGRIWNRTRRELKNELNWWERTRRRLSGRSTQSQLGKPEDRGGPLPPLDPGDE